MVEPHTQLSGDVPAPVQPRRRSAAAMLPAALTAAALVAAPFAGSSTGPLTGHAAPVQGSAGPWSGPTDGTPMTTLGGAYVGIAAAAGRALGRVERRTR